MKASGVAKRGKNDGEDEDRKSENETARLYTILPKSTHSPLAVGYGNERTSSHRTDPQYSAPNLLDRMLGVLPTERRLTTVTLLRLLKYALFTSGVYSGGVKYVTHAPGVKSFKGDSDLHTECEMKLVS